MACANRLSAAKIHTKKIKPNSKEEEKVVAKQWNGLYLSTTQHYYAHQCLLCGCKATQCIRCSGHMLIHHNPAKLWQILLIIKITTPLIKQLKAMVRLLLETALCSTLCPLTPQPLQQ